MKQHFRSAFCLISAVTFGCAPLVRPVAAVPAKPSATKPSPAKPLPLDIKLGKPVEGTVEGDPLQSLGTFPATFNGKLAYTFIVKRLPYLNYLVLTQVSHRGKEQVTNTLTYPVIDLLRVTNDVSDPQFSPDGQYVLFKWGTAGSMESAVDLYLWNLKTQQLRRVTKERFAYRFSMWSPDSNHIVYIRNGDIEGNPLRDDLELCVYDLKTEQEHSIVKNSGVRNSVSWTPQNTLLYSVFAKEPQPRKKQATGAKQEPEPYVEPILRYDTYESFLSGGKPKLIVKNGFQATASPDGKWITVFGSRDPLKPMLLSTQPWKISRGAVLLVMKRDGSDRRVFALTDKTYPSVLWLPDSKGFITLKPLPQAAGTQAQISRWNVVTRESRQIALLKAKEDEEMTHMRQDTAPNFSNLQLSKSGTSLFVNVSEIGPADPSQDADVFNSLQAVDLQSGTISKFLQLKRASGLDWHEELTESTTTTQKLQSN